MSFPFLFAVDTATETVATAAINWHTVFFLLFALISCGMALAVLFTSNIVRMAFYLTISLGAVSGLFILAGAHFVGAMQLMIYVGGTLVLLIFGVMLTAQVQFIEMKARGGEWVLATIVGGSMLAVLLAAAVRIDAWHHPTAEHLAAIDNVDVSPDSTSLGTALLGLRVDKLSQSNEQLRRGMSGYFVHFEIVSVHLLVVLIGAAYLARARLQVGDAPVARRVVLTDRRRGSLVTVLLFAAIAAHAFCGAVCFVPGAEFKSQLPGLASAPIWLWSVLGVCCLINALLLLVVLNWQRWGYFALIVLAVIEAGLLNAADVSSLATAVMLIATFVWLAILFGLLKLGGLRSMWAQME